MHLVAPGESATGVLSKRSIACRLALKFDFWGHDSVVLHGHEIRKAVGDFNILLNPKTRATFIDLVSAARLARYSSPTASYRYLGMASAI